ncbi:MAG: alpha-amylase family glycosyl hydrolase, partial [Ruminococcus sp.]|nr:alpha-amylase family glycosyl hydrolase [Ruminococcus sp.]
MSYINESVIYNIYPLGFCGAPKENDGKLVYRLDKIYDCIEHMKKMSVNVLVFNPLFESSRHGYDTIDYRKVDCRLGDNNSFKKICKALHANDIKIILDGVFNHVGRDFFAFKDVQKNLQNSRYCSWFQNLNFGGNSPKGDPFWYEGWAGHYDLVKLNLQNEDVVNYLLDSVKFWIDEFDIDGLRLDAADCIDIEFFKKLRHVCKSKKPDFWLYGEITHGDYNRWANNDTLDSVTNYECYKG